MDYKFIDVNNLSELRSFIKQNTSENFRYYDKRDFSVISNHLVTYLAYQNGDPVAYGHLDFENAVVWLGVLVGKEYRGKGYGKQMTTKLVEFADQNELNLCLTVDKSNQVAMIIYQALNFRVFKENDKIFFMERLWRIL